MYADFQFESGRLLYMVHTGWVSKPCLELLIASNDIRMKQYLQAQNNVKYFKS